VQPAGRPRITATINVERERYRRCIHRRLDGPPIGVCPGHEATARPTVVAWRASGWGAGLHLSRAVEPSLAARCAAGAHLLPVDSAFSGVTAAVLLGAPLSEPPRVQWHSDPGRSCRRTAVWSCTVAGSTPGTSGRTADCGSPRGADLPRPGRGPRRGPRAPGAGRRGWCVDGRPATWTPPGSRLGWADRVRGVVRARACAPLLNPLAQSRPEGLMRYWPATSDLPDPEPQLAVLDRWGRDVAQGDLGYSRWNVLHEYEGRQHADTAQFRRDVDRYWLMAAGGWLVLRFAGQHLTGPHPIVERTRGALLSRGWRPGCSSRPARSARSARVHPADPAAASPPARSRCPPPCAGPPRSASAHRSAGRTRHRSWGRR
jgi:hypothetical protein